MKLLSLIISDSEILDSFNSLKTLREILLSRVRRSKEGRGALYGENFPSSRER
jgi:hypothetical protein